MGGEKGRQENDGSADAPHRQLRDGRKRGGRKQNADQRLLCVTWIRVLDGSAVDAIVLMRQRVESKRGDAGGKSEGVVRLHVFHRMVSPIQSPTQRSASFS